MLRGITLFIGFVALACNGGGDRGSASDGFGAGTGSASATTTGDTGVPLGPEASASTGGPTSGPAEVTATAGPTSGGTTNSMTGTSEPEPDTTGGEPGSSSTATATPNTGETGTSDDSGGDPEMSTGGDPEMSTGGGEACVQVLCGGALYDCGDCLDNDGDGKVDQADPECVSPCDDREDTFATGLPGDNVDPCKQDCFFDGNSGAGGGDCQWNLKCDAKSPGGDKCPYDPGYKNCPDEQTQTCVESCQVPNGCDCFGCCTVVVDGVTHDIFLGDKDCSIAQIDQCSQCTKNPDCSNDCDPDDCELCFGEDELPPGCSESSCDEGTPCEVDDQGGSSCAEGFFCSTGCCVPIMPG